MRNKGKSAVQKLSTARVTWPPASWNESDFYREDETRLPTQIYPFNFQREYAGDKFTGRYHSWRDQAMSGVNLGIATGLEIVASVVEPLLRFHESGGHEGDGSDERIALIRAALKETPNVG
ncbi:hypothetical protein [Sphingomonas sp.]|uniref:hypothetical protein n=1 Tax=Sphingomonas sp. TaxID=28214 RepID=UPI0031DC4E60